MASPGKKHYPLRMDPKIFEALQRWAEDEFRSVNQHMEYLLRDALRKAGKLPKDTPEPKEDNTP